MDIDNRTRIIPCRAWNIDPPGTDPRPSYFTGADLTNKTADTRIGIDSLIAGHWRPRACDTERARDLFRLPEQATPMAINAVGYYGAIDDLEQDFIEDEKA